MPDIQSVLQQFPELIDVNVRTTALGNHGGFSGAQLWKLESGDLEKPYCLRRWPIEHPNRDQLSWIHGALNQARMNDVTVVPRIYRTNQDNTFVERNGALWELTDWLPGQADFHESPNDQRLSDAMQTLAKCHKGFAQYQLDFRKSNGLEARFHGLQGLKAFFDQLDIVRPSHRGLGGELESLIIVLRTKAVQQQLLSQADLMKSRLADWIRQPIPVQPVIRDLWHDHLLFTGDHLTGIVDFGAMAMDSVALDLSRLLRSLFGDEKSQWAKAIAMYETQRSLLAIEREVLDVVDRSSVLVSAMNWVRWIAFEGRVFEDSTSVDARVRRLREWIGDWLLPPLNEDLPGTEARGVRDET